MGRVFRSYLAGESVFSCRSCGNHLAVRESVISDNFHGQHGKAFLFQHVVNIYTSPQAEDRTMLTGRHTVRDLYCRECRATLGWTYVFAYEPTEKYKEGKFILELERVKERQGKKDLGLPRIESRDSSSAPSTRTASSASVAVARG